MNKNKPAFPYGQENLGLSKREYFAIMALQGLLGYETKNVNYRDNLVVHAIEYADKLLRELERSNE